jgi:uncharacterized protein YcgI (DUF1989 family)
MPISPHDLIEIAPCSAHAFIVPAGAQLHVIDPCGEQVADLVLFTAADLRETLSNGRTFDYASSLRLSTGSVLYSNRSVPLATIVADDVGTHDFLLTPCSRDTWRLCYKDPADERPGCFGNLVTALAPYGIAPDMIPTTFNCFMHVRVGADGALAVLPPRSRAGDRISFLAHVDLVAGLTACSAPLSNNGRYKPIAYAVEPARVNSTARA